MAAGGILHFWGYGGILYVSTKWRQSEILQTPKEETNSSRNAGEGGIQPPQEGLAACGVVQKAEEFLPQARWAAPKPPTAIPVMRPLRSGNHLTSTAMGTM